MGRYKGNQVKCFTTAQPCNANEGFYHKYPALLQLLAIMNVLHAKLSQLIIESHTLQSTLSVYITLI